MGAMGAAEQRFRDELVWSVIHVCMNDRYALVTDFVWYLTVLADLARVPSSSHGGLVAGGLHWSTSQLNLSDLYEIGGVRRGCVARVEGVLGGV